MAQILAAIMNIALALVAVPLNTCLLLLYIAPLKLRRAGAAAGASGKWLFCFITVFATEIALQNVGWKIWSCPASRLSSLYISCILKYALTYCTQRSLLTNLKKTTGKTLKEIDVLFAKEDIQHTIFVEQLVMQSSVRAEKGEVLSIHIKTS
ncbi:unnamed protein product [Fusarium graminearum]|nr:unnamed protein product [Fusarium graminearum]